VAAIYRVQPAGVSLSIGSYGGLHLVITLADGRRLRGELVMERHEPAASPATTTVAATASKVLHGAAALAKAAVGLDQAAPDVIAQRQQSCDGCMHKEKKLIGSWCGLCGCALAAKIRLASERCPAGVWQR